MNRQPLEFPVNCPRHIALVAALALALTTLTCSVPGLFPTPTPTIFPTPTSEPADTGWQPLEPGAEMRVLLVPTGDVVERLVLVRLDPSRFRFRVRYTPGSARRVSEWAAAETADTFLLVVNGGYFTPEYLATGLLVSDGQVYNTSYGDFAGMFAVLPDGRVQVRWLAEQPYTSGESLQEAVQCFPLLVKPGGVMGFPTVTDTPARRTVVAQDREGRIIFVAAPRGYLTLHQLARWLTESDLGLDVAINLDGGQSTGLVLSLGEPLVHIDSIVPVPAVIVVERR